MKIILIESLSDGTPVTIRGSASRNDPDLPDKYMLQDALEKAQQISQETGHTVEICRLVGTVRPAILPSVYEPEPPQNDAERSIVPGPTPQAPQARSVPLAPQAKAAPMPQPVEVKDDDF